MQSPPGGGTLVRACFPLAMSEPLRIVLAEDQVLLRQGIARLLGDAGFEVVAEAGDAPDLLRKVAAHRPDVAIVDVQMPPDHDRRRPARGDRDPRAPSGASACSSSPSSSSSATRST